MTKTIKVPPCLELAKDIEEILCLASLIASGILEYNATIEDARDYFDNLPDENCYNCPLFSKCLACIINE